MKELIGQSLDRYQLVSLLGEGGMGAVFKARDITLQRDVAIKIMHPQFARRPDFQERFLQEARTAARMSHPGIVQVHDFGQARSHLYIVMEFIAGDNLRQMLQNLRATSQWIVLPEAIQIVQQVSLALDYAHRQGVLHRDIKPDNVMLKPEPSEGLPYRPVITDLGLAKLAEGGIMTVEGTSMGTPAYMSPEQAMGKKTDARSDVYSLGILLYELTVGQLPFPVRTITEAIRYHTKEPPPPPRSIRPDLPEPAERVILKAVEKDPTDRFPDAKALAQALADTLPAASVATAAPSALAGAVSLMTQYQQSLVEARGPSILDEFPEPPADLSQDRIVIMAPDRTIHSVSMKPQGLTIGRSADNDVTLDDSQVSRHHTRIEFDGTNYQVVDLNSTNGTYLANVKLLPGVPEVWTPDKPLRIGNHWLRLERAQQPAMPGRSVMFRSDGSMVAPSLIRSSAGPARVGVFMEMTELSVGPGSSTTASAIILNQGPVVDHFQTSVVGVPADWVPVTPPPIRLMPGAQQEVTLTIQPPRSPKSRAGDYPLTIRVASQDAPDQVAEVKGTLTMAAYSQFSSDLRPQRIRAGKTAQVTVQNQGNARQTFTLTWQDRADELAFQPPQAQLTVPEGQVAAAEFRAVPRQRRWIGGTKTHPFSTHVSSPEGETQTRNGEVLSKGLIPAWVPPVLLFLCVALAAMAAWAYNVIISKPTEATATAWAVATETAQVDATKIAADNAAATATAQAATATAEFLAGANQATIEAATATAIEAATATATWMDQDDDRDGLTNRQELDLNTLPDVRDTDEDGLDDGDELNRGTEPLNADTDDDGLKDGDEVSRGIDPLKEDTDDDGTPDASDDDPGQAPTLIPTETPTPTATPTESVEMVVLPNVIDRTEADARRILEDACEPHPCVNVQVQRESHDSVERDRVIRSEPAAGAEVSPGGVVKLTISTGHEPTRETVVLSPDASLSGRLSPEGCSAPPIRAGIAPKGNGIRGVASFDISDLNDAPTILAATLDLSNYTLNGNPFEFLHPLHVEQVEYRDRCDYPDTYSGDARTSLARVSDAVPGLRNLIDVTTELANYLASGNPEYFQIRLRFEGDYGGSAYASMVEWSTIRLTIEYER